MAQNILTVKDLSVSYKAHGKGLFGEEKKIQVLNGVSFEMKEGEILGLVGESGSGKSTLAKAVLGLIPYQGGGDKQLSPSPDDLSGSLQQFKPGEKSRLAPGGGAAAWRGEEEGHPQTAGGGNAAKGRTG